MPPCVLVAFTKNIFPAVLSFGVHCWSGVSALKAGILTEELEKWVYYADNSFNAAEKGKQVSGNERLHR